MNSQFILFYFSVFIHVFNKEVYTLNQLYLQTVRPTNVWLGLAAGETWDL